MNYRIVINNPSGRGRLSYLLTDTDAAEYLNPERTRLYYNKFHPDCPVLSCVPVENIGINHIPSQEQFERAMPAVECFNHA